MPKPVKTTTYQIPPCLNFCLSSSKRQRTSTT